MCSTHSDTVTQIHHKRIRIESQTTMKKICDIIPFVCISECFSVRMYVRLFIFAVSDTISHNIYSTFGACDIYSITHAKKSEDMNAIKMNGATKKNTTYNVYAYTCFVSIKQPKHSSTQLRSPITFDSTSFFNSLYVLYAHCLPFEFLWFFLSHFDTFICMHLHWLHIYTQR